MKKQSYDQFVAQLASVNGLSLERAREFVTMTGTSPEIIDGNKVVVHARNGAVMARLVWPESYNE